jgi:hypothetical protein
MKKLFKFIKNNFGNLLIITGSGFLANGFLYGKLYVISSSQNETITIGVVLLVTGILIRKGNK